MLSQRSLPLLLAALFLTTLFALLGCGGGGGGNLGGGGPTTLSRTPIQSMIALPAGSAVADPSTLTVWTSVSESPIAATGASTIEVFNGGPQYAEARDTNGDAILMGFIGNDRTTMDAASTAEVLAFFYTGGAFQPSETTMVYLRDLRTMGGFQAVVDAVSAQLATGVLDPHEPALEQALRSLEGEVNDRGRGAIVTPTSNSGLSIDTTVDGEITLEHVNLGSKVGWLQREGYTDSSGTFVEEKGPAQRIEIPSVKRFSGTVGTLVDITKGDISYSPVRVGPFEVPKSPSDARSTRYTLKWAGLGAQASYVSSFTPEQRQAINQHAYKNILVEGLFPVLFKVILPLPQAGDILNDVVGNPKFAGLFADAMVQLTIVAPGLYEQSANGDLSGALQSAWENVLTTGSFVNALTEFITGVFVEYGADKAVNGTKLMQSVQNRLVLIGIVDIIGNGIDTVLLMRDYAKSKHESAHVIEITGGKITLTAEKRYLSYYGQTLINTIIQDKNDDYRYRYEFSVDDPSRFKLQSNYGDTDSAPNNVISSPEPFVSAYIKDSERGTTTIKCVAYRTDIEPEQVIDDATIEIHFVDPTSITPEDPQVNPGAAVTITADYPGPETVKYKFTLLTPETGSINRTEATSNPSCTFTAGPDPGSGVIKVETIITVDGSDFNVQEQTVGIDILGENGTQIPLKVAHYVMPIPDSDLFVGRALAYCEITPVEGATGYAIAGVSGNFAEWEVGEIPGGKFDHPAWERWFREAEKDPHNCYGIDWKEKSFEDAGEAAAYAEEWAETLYDRHAGQGQLYFQKTFK